MPRYDLTEVKSAAAGYWRSVVTQLGGIDDQFITTAHGPCPKCGGNDRWRVFNDFDQTGGGVCNQCGKFGDGLALVQWLTGKKFPESLSAVADFLGVKPEATARGGSKGGSVGKKKPSTAGKPKARPSDGSPALDDKYDPLSAVEIVEWNPLLVRFWCAKKRVSMSAVLRANGSLVRYKRYMCVGFPVRSAADDELIGWALYEVGGGLLPVFAKGSPVPIEYTKVKILKKRGES